jgi:recombination protein RecA
VTKKEVNSFLDGMHDQFDIKQGWKKEVVGTGILALDHLTSKGGMPRGMLVDLYGDEGLGKTTVALTMAGERMRHGERCVYIDVEHRLQDELVEIVAPGQDRRYNPDGLLDVYEPPFAEDAFGILERALAYKEIRMVVLDSVAALLFKEEAELDKYTSPMGLLARRIGAFSRKILRQIHEFGCLVIFINQMRQQITSYGPILKQSTGGKALRFYSSLRINMEPEKYIMKGETVIGRKARVSIDKNSFGFPERQVTVPIIYGTGVDPIRDMIDCGLLTGAIVQSGPYFKFRKTDAKGKLVEEIQAHGEAALVEKLAPMVDEIRENIRQQIVALSVKQQEVEDEKAEKPDEEHEK